MRRTETNLENTEENLETKILTIFGTTESRKTIQRTRRNAYVERYRTKV